MSASPLSRISYSTISYCYDELVKACERGYVSEVRKHIPWTIPTLNQAYPLSVAASFGHVECVKELLEVAGVDRYSGRAMAYACSKGQAACVEALVAVAAEDSFELCFSVAARQGHCAVIQILLQHNTNPLYLANAMRTAAGHGQALGLALLSVHLHENNQAQDVLHDALTYAIAKEDVDCVKILLPLVQIKNTTRYLLECFKKPQVNLEIFVLLFPFTDAKAALNEFVEQYSWEDEKIQWLGQQIQHETLRLAVASHPPDERAQRKI